MRASPSLVAQSEPQSTAIGEGVVKPCVGEDTAAGGLELRACTTPKTLVAEAERRGTPEVQRSLGQLEPALASLRRAAQLSADRGGAQRAPRAAISRGVEGALGLCQGRAGCFRTLRV